MGYIFHGHLDESLGVFNEENDDEKTQIFVKQIEDT